MIRLLEFQEIKLDDIKALAPLFMETFNTFPWNEAWTIETVEKRLHQLINVEDFYGLLATQKENLCGFALGSMEQYYDGQHFYLKEICVKNDLRGQGIGAQILETLENTLKKQQVKEIFLYTTRGAKGFYLKKKYQEPKLLTILNKNL